MPNTYIAAGASGAAGVSTTGAAGASGAGAAGSSIKSVDIKKRGKEILGRPYWSKACKATMYGCAIVQ